MSKEIVKYNNNLNLISFKNFSKIENDVFFALIYKLKNKSTNEIKVDFTELKNLIDMRNATSQEIRQQIKDIAKKITQSIVEWETEETTKFFTLFQILEVPNKGDFYIRAKISEPFEYLINNLKQGFTMFELLEFSSLSSKYTQTLYRLLKQFRSTGEFKIKWIDFVEVMDIPGSYNMGTIDNQILKPSIKELSEQTLFSTGRIIFKNLKFNKIRGKTKGRPVTHIEFNFDPENTQNKKQKKAEKIAFDNQFYGKKFKFDNVTFLIWGITRTLERIKVRAENLSTHEQHQVIFKSEEQLLDAIKKYK